MRCVLEGTEEARVAAAKGTVVSLLKQVPCNVESQWCEHARSGNTGLQPTRPTVLQNPATNDSADLVCLSEPETSIGSLPPTLAKVPGLPPAYVVTREQKSRVPAPTSISHNRQNRFRYRIVLASLAAACCLALISCTAYIYLHTPHLQFSQVPADSSNASPGTTDNAAPIVAEIKVENAQTTGESTDPAGVDTSHSSKTIPASDDKINSKIGAKTPEVDPTKESQPEQSRSATENSTSVSKHEERSTQIQTSERTQTQTDSTPSTQVAEQSTDNIKSLSQEPTLEFVIDGPKLLSPKPQLVATATIPLTKDTQSISVWNTSANEWSSKMKEGSNIGIINKFTVYAKKHEVVITVTTSSSDQPLHSHTALLAKVLRARKGFSDSIEDFNMAVKSNMVAPLPLIRIAFDDKDILKRVDNFDNNDDVLKCRSLIADLIMKNRQMSRQTNPQNTEKINNELNAIEFKLNEVVKAAHELNSEIADISSLEAIVGKLKFRYDVPKDKKAKDEATDEEHLCYSIKLTLPN